MEDFPPEAVPHLLSICEICDKSCDFETVQRRFQRPLDLDFYLADDDEEDLSAIKVSLEEATDPIKEEESPDDEMSSPAKSEQDTAFDDAPATQSDRTPAMLKRSFPPNAMPHLQALAWICDEGTGNKPWRYLFQQGFHGDYKHITKEVFDSWQLSKGINGLGPSMFTSPASPVAVNLVGSKKQRSKKLKALIMQQYIEGEKANGADEEFIAELRVASQKRLRDVMIGRREQYLGEAAPLHQIEIEYVDFGKDTGWRHLQARMANGGTKRKRAGDRDWFGGGAPKKITEVREQKWWEEVFGLKQEHS
ncbi:hypothetical protein M427DRAFT_75245 [Gonapodya prolifera JEL478]|uniref:Uncharacterized protein n=1 Tax=Gonapodya prolifera (strain JEL478) TaxID=1344416 RepID=A0A138ZYP3_GONPJ|nr:hypothetical protein M427DRAFT_75245 [Gonapodya prolifera JEL478]|eukprot:KXS09624.1 hypothetical protein M427DRAFT_75245 [Gonapodya prolifera JEL478]